MRTKYLLASVAVGAVCGAASYFLKKKLTSTSAGANASVSAPASGKPAAVPQMLGQAAYSFISGFKDASTVELRFPYDADRFSFSVHEDDFLTESGDSHVGVLYGESFSAQFEYGSYYSGEDFAKLRQELSAKHKDLVDVSYGAHAGLKYRDGDNLCVVFPIPDDVHSYLLVTLVKAPDNDDELEALADYPDLRAMLSELSFART